jgi:hypothetical protein
VIDEILQPAVKSAMAIYAITANYEKARKTKNQEEMAKWSRPLGGMLKLNVDAALNHDTNACATGVVIRDEKGSCCFAVVGISSEWIEEVLPLTNDQ